MPVLGGFLAGETICIVAFCAEAMLGAMAIAPKIEQKKIEKKLRILRR
jgi:hypothetical protein